MPLQTGSPGAVALTGLIGAGTVVAMFYLFSDPSQRSDTFLFTALYTAFQIIAICAVKIYTSRMTERGDVVAPVSSAMVTVVVGYSGITVLLILLFHSVLSPYRTPRNYYTINAAVVALTAASLLWVQSVAVAHKRGHRQAAQARQGVDQLLVSCDALKAPCAMNGWNLDVGKMAERIRFSEGIRRNPALAQSVSEQLAQLERLVQQQAGEGLRREGERIVRAVELLAERRA